MGIGNNIKRLRKINRLSQEKLAEIIDVSRQAVAKWESGKCYPDINKLIILSNIFNVTSFFLLKTLLIPFGSLNFITIGIDFICKYENYDLLKNCVNWLCDYLYDNNVKYKILLIPFYEYQKNDSLFYNKLKNG